MQATILYGASQRVEVVVLSVGRYAMRVVPRESDDTMELTLQYGQWVDEAGVPVEFEAFVVDDENDVRSVIGGCDVYTAAS